MQTPGYAGDQVWGSSPGEARLTVPRCARQALLHPGLALPVANLLSVSPEAPTGHHSAKGKLFRLTFDSATWVRLHRGHAPPTRLRVLASPWPQRGSATLFWQLETLQLSAGLGFEPGTFLCSYPLGPLLPHCLIQARF